MTPACVVIDGWFRGKFGQPKLVDQMAEFGAVEIVSPFKRNGWPMKLFPGKIRSWIDARLPPGPYWVCGRSWGAEVAADLAERDPSCQGLLYISGLTWKPEGVVHRPLMYTMGKVTPRWDGFPVLCLCTDGEKLAIVHGTDATGECLDTVGCSVEFHIAPNPNTHRKPHLAGVGHHLPEIRSWLNRHFNHGSNP